MSNDFQVPRVRKLPGSLANQIAAGEVIERPASVVKELLENCLDAGATRISVEVRKAGTQFIRVTDNGHGIHPDDLELALQRHATAKLHNESDLAAISTLGFRGEALPSISSVANFAITSRVKVMDHALRLVIDPASGGRESGPAAHPPGTTVEVSNLFHNTPARKKYLSSERTEFLHIQEMVRRLALSRFDFTLDLLHNNKQVFRCRAVRGEPSQRVAAVLGPRFVNKAMVVEHDVGNMRLWGWLGVADLARSTTDRQYLYLNGRMIYDRRLNHAIRAACEELVAIGRFPSYALYLEMDAGAADVNVHPSKHEVRFYHARDVHDFLYAALSASFRENHDLNHLAEAVADENLSAAPTGGQARHFSPAQNRIAQARSVYSELSAGRQAELGDDETAFGKVLLQFSPEYMLTKRDNQLLLISIRAAKEQVARVRLQSAGSLSPVRGRPLLVPVSFTITADQEAGLSSLGELLAEYSLQLESSGPSLCRVREIPHVLEQADLALLVNDLLDVKLSVPADEVARQKLIEIMVSHACDIPDMNMSLTEMTGLLRQLAESGVDTSSRRFPPIWAALDEGDLRRIVSHDA